MGLIGLFGSPCRSLMMRAIILLCFAMLSQTQPPPSPSLPVQISIPAPWLSLPVSQSDLGLLFTNSSPSSFTQSLVLLPPAGLSSKPVLRATFGPYSVSQLVSEPIVPLSVPLAAFLFSEPHLRGQEAERGQRLMVRVLFHMRGDTRGGTCVTLHAFKQTEELKASCITQPPLGLCLVTMTFPQDWFEPEQIFPPDQIQKSRQRHPNRLRSRTHGLSWQNFPASLRTKPGIVSDVIQLYYSSSGGATKRSPPRCVEDKLKHSQRNLYYVGSVPLPHKEAESNETKQGLSCTDELHEDKLWLNPDVLVEYDKGPVRAGHPSGVALKIRADFSADFLLIRLKVKKGFLSFQAQPATSSDQWNVIVEKTTVSKHDTLSIICHRIGAALDQTGVSALRQVACLTVRGLHRSFGVAMTVAVHWWVEHSVRSQLVLPHGAVTSFFSFTDREIVGVAPITESNTIINTALLTSHPVSLAVIVLGVGRDERVSDITAAVKCQSANEDILKVSSDCSALFVDGSESGAGSTCVEVEFSLGRLRHSLCLAVWAPIVPLQISLSDSVLSPIEGWSYRTERGCSPVYQRSAVQVLAQFGAQPAGPGGEPTYMLGSPDWFVDVTVLVHDWLRIEDPHVATLNEHGYIIGLEPGVTSVNVAGFWGLFLKWVCSLILSLSPIFLHVGFVQPLKVISSQWDGVLGSADVIVTSEPVAPSDLAVQLVGGLGLSVTSSSSNPAVNTATVTSHNVLYSHGQEASVSVWLQFSDDTAALLSTFSGVPLSLRLSSLADSVVAVSPGPSQRVLAQGDGGGPLVKADLLVSSCEPDNIRERGLTRRLAKGSGWIRVNLDSDLWPAGSEDADFDDLAELENDYNSTNDDHEDMMARNDLERAVLTPGHEENVVLFSPEVEQEQEGGEDDERLGLGFVFSLLFVSSFLCLVSCVPCALRKLRRLRGDEREAETDEDEGQEDQNVEKRQEVIKMIL